MFTGIISAIGHISDIKQQGDLQITVSCPWDSLSVGESVAVNGVCLTVLESQDWHVKSDSMPFHTAIFKATLSAETLARTTPRWSSGDKVNLERAMKLGDSLDGHLVTGHVDGLARITAITQQGGSHSLEVEAPAALSHYIAEKGSVTLDGVSLTVNNVEGPRFWVNIIPHTWQVTTLGERKAGDRLNLEIDLIARYVERLLSSRA